MDSDSPKKWGENKLIFEEAAVAAMLAFALGLVAGAALLPANAGHTVAAWLGLADLTAATGGFTLWLVSLLFAGTAAATAAAVGFWLFGWQRSFWVFAGATHEPDIFAFSAALAKHEAALFSDAQRAAARANAPAPRGLLLGGIELSRTRETGHVAVYGLPGSGKTVLLRGLIAAALARGDSVLAHDPKGEFADAYGTENWCEHVVLLGPWDSRARPWDIGADIATPALADGFAGGLFPAEGRGANQFFTNAARSVFAGVLKHLQASGAWDWLALADVLEAGPHAITAAAHSGDAVNVTLLADPDSRQGQAVLADMIAKVSWVSAYARAFAPEARPFALSGWLRGETRERVILLNADRRFAERGEQLFGALLAVAASVIASPAMAEKSADAEGCRWLVMDEFPQLGLAAQAGILTAEEMGRSRGVRVVKAMQDPSQLSALAGRERGEVFRSMQQTRVFLKLSGSAAAETARQFGENELRRVEFPHIVGGGSKRIVADRGPVIRADALTGLRVRPGAGVEAVVSIDALLGTVLVPFSAFPSGAGAQKPNPRWDSVAPAALAIAPPAAAGEGGEALSLDEEMREALGLDDAEPEQVAADPILRDGGGENDEHAHGWEE